MPNQHEAEISVDEAGVLKNQNVNLKIIFDVAYNLFTAYVKHSIETGFPQHRLPEFCSLPVMAGAIKSVVIVGANGRLGPSILRALLEVEDFKVSALVRASSKSTYPDAVNVIKVDDDLPYDQLVKALIDQDALVISFSGNERDASIKLADAAFEAGVKHVIPADYGSCDSSDPKSLDLIPLYVNKKDVRDYLIELSGRERSSGEKLGWTSFITGHFFDYGLKSGLLAVDVDKRTALVFDGGNYKFAATVLRDIGLCAARILQRADDPRLKNKLVYVQSVQTTQNELVAAVEEVTGNKLQVEQVTSDDFIKENKESLRLKPGDHDITENLVTVGGIINTDWDTKGDLYVNDLLGLPVRDLKQLVAEALA